MSDPWFMSKSEKRTAKTKDGRHITLSRLAIPYGGVTPKSHSVRIDGFKDEEDARWAADMIAERCFQGWDE